MSAIRLTSVASAAAPRRMLCSSRQTIIAGRRLASTSSTTTEKAKETADSAAEKTKQTANSAAETAKSYIDQASESGSKILNQVSNTAGGLLGSYREPIVYNLSVIREIGKQVYIQEKLAPPTQPQVIRSAYEDFYRKASDASWWRSILESGEWKRVALYAIEAYGIFTIGEMIGRRHIVGYKKPEGLEEHHGHH